MYSVPKDENRRKQWTDSVGKYLPVGAFICSKHFPIQSIGALKLLKGSKPAFIDTDPEVPLNCFPNPSGSLPDSPDSVPKSQNPVLQSSHIQSDYIPYPFDIVTNLFSLIKNDEISIDLPPYWSFNKLENHIVFSKVALKENDMPYLERSVVLTADTIQARIMHRVVDIMKSVTTVYDLEDYLRRLDGKKICSIKRIAYKSNTSKK
ncbi:uncharacterized protein LOC123672790 [Harmonia axyridis]|uniref:uncharacterized protein LOC123672790 n=1 Tax=Harmonia axyridis TaxID=115357 RepID=UPI001E27938E|nr:uncharacterized protein LOC123672790 [Harmonia axyridis]